MAIVLPMIFMLLLGMGIGIWIVNPIVRKQMMFADTPKEHGINISSDGTEVRINDGNDDVRRYVLSTPYDLTTITLGEKL